MTTSVFKTAGRRGARLAMMGAGLALLAACQTTGAAPQSEGIGYREARFAEVQAMEDYRACLADAQMLDGQARTARDRAKYLASARLIERCEAELGPAAAQVAVEERMRGYGLAVQNYLKAGDVAKARSALRTFESAFPGKDLYYADGSSFIETMHALTGRAEDEDFGRFSMLNVSPSLKDEMRRVSHWSKN